MNKLLALILMTPLLCSAQVAGYVEARLDTSVTDREVYGFEFIKLESRPHGFVSGARSWDRVVADTALFSINKFGWYAVCLVKEMACSADTTDKYFYHSGTEIVLVTQHAIDNGVVVTVKPRHR